MDGPRTKKSGEGDRPCAGVSQSSQPTSLQTPCRRLLAIHHYLLGRYWNSAPSPLSLLARNTGTVSARVYLLAPSSNSVCCNGTKPSSYPPKCHHHSHAAR
ncbi:hypothetical protein VFPPC_02798 [Pochonia chlamydosporia 170]|uniref:Uncharacterized protein n=1 Tax=Pochonia chlamydosporia 170 TaxID=1380566 RepID=A0A179FZB7_METCM|nr:hypothetical protein VFPPC_02798 [Pochonia chlamydosporia 170]OAQ70309.1 hypothetical protein VFPPC_02798 [Pochonia chlamydosporia 170]